MNSIDEKVAVELVKAAGKAKDERAFSALVFKARKYFSGQHLTAVAGAMRMEFDRAQSKKGNPTMAAKKKKKRKNPYPATFKNPKKKKVVRKRFTVKAYSGSTCLGVQTFASQKAAEKVAKRLVGSGKATKAYVED